MMPKKWAWGGVKSFLDKEMRGGLADLVAVQQRGKGNPGAFKTNPGAFYLSDGTDV